MADSQSLSSYGIRVADLSCRYPDGTEALRGINLVIHPGEAFALIGPNGAGKSSLLLCLAGLLEFSGEVLLGDQRMTPQSARELRRGLALVFQDPEDQLFMPTLEEDVAFGPTNLGLSAGEIARRVKAALDQVSLWEKRHKPPHHLSAGEKRCAALATAFAMQPQILLLDEPTSNLDPGSRRELMILLKSLPVTRIIATHDLDLAASLSERCAVLSAGRIVAVGPTSQMLADVEMLKTHRLS